MGKLAVSCWPALFRSHPGRACLVVAVSLASACAPKAVPLPTVSTPKYPEFLPPVVAPADVNSPAGIGVDRAWRFLQAGDLKSAERELGGALQNAPGFAPAEVSLGYVELARKDGKAALPHFDRALERQPDDISALVGRGETLIALGREADAVAPLERATTLDASLTDIARRVEVLKFRTLQENLAAARQAARSGRLDEAERAYANAIASTPESAFLYRELAAIERQKGELDAALGDFRKAISLDPADRNSHVQIGDLLEARGDIAGAATAYNDALALEPGDDVQAKLDALRDRTAAAQLPDEYRAIGSAAQITRADLAALIGVRLPRILQSARRRDAVVVTDVRDSWAVSWIMAVARAGVMEPFANHTFQPRTLVRRADFAQVMARLLALVQTDQSTIRSWQSARVKFSDVAPGHLAYEAASTSVQAGVMTVGPENAFEPSKPVSGADALAAIARIEALDGAKGARRSR